MARRMLIIRTARKWIYASVSRRGDGVRSMPIGSGDKIKPHFRANTVSTAGGRVPTVTIGNGGGYVCSFQGHYRG